MARGYPRFLFSNPQNTKSKGPFIVHTLDPMIICKVLRPNEFVTSNELHGIREYDTLHLELLRPVPRKENGNDGFGIDIINTLDDMNQWLVHQIKSGEIKL